MKIVRDLEAVERANDKAAVFTIGVFDGVHRGHQQLLSLAKAIAEKNSASLLTVTFTNHPYEQLKGVKSRRPIYPLELRCHLLEECGVDILLLLTFTKSLAERTAEEFLLSIATKFPLCAIVLGYDTTFGCDQENNREAVALAAKKIGAELHSCHPFIIDNDPVSSRRIRKLLEKGEFLEAERLLGRPLPNDFENQFLS